MRREKTQIQGLQRVAVMRASRYVVFYDGIMDWRLS